MKKIIIVILVILFAGLSLSADFDYQLDLISLDPLHKEYFADRSKPETSLTYLFFIEGFPDRLIQDKYVSEGNPNYVKVYNFNGEIPGTGKMVRFNLGETISLLRNTFTFDSWLSPIALDFSFQPLLSFLFTGKFDDNIGYDGIYFFGGTFSIADKVSMRIGYHHYCSHYGDAIIKRISTGDRPGTIDGSFWLTYKYVRMNDLCFGLSIEPFSWLRLYGEYLYPPRNIRSLRPDMFAPNWVERNGHAINPDYPDSYNSRIVSLGIELTYALFPKLGETTIGYDLHMYEEGKVKYDSVNGGPITFDEDSPWDIEHTVALEQQLGSGLSFKMTYHNGRSPSSFLYFMKTSYLSIGMRFNPDSSLKLFNVGT